MVAWPCGFGPTVRRSIMEKLVVEEAAHLMAARKPRRRESFYLCYESIYVNS
jgi:hypothetical protein